MIYTYAVFSSDGDQYHIEFPDLDGVFSFGENMSDALAMAHDLLKGWLIVAEYKGDLIPKFSLPHELKIQSNDLIIPIKIDLNLDCLKHSNKLIKKR